MRVRITFSKTGALRYIGHLDLQTLWERTIRRAALPLAYTQGFHPTPKIQIAAALPLGFSGRQEIVDVWLQGEIGAEEIGACATRLQAAAPPGLTILSVEQVDEHEPALQTQVLSAEYEAVLLNPIDKADLSERIAALLAADSLPRQRRGKPYDLRPLIESLRIAPSEHAEGNYLRMILAAREGNTGRPDEVLAALGIPAESTRIERTRLIMKNSLE